MIRCLDVLETVGKGSLGRFVLDGKVGGMDLVM